MKNIEKKVAQHYSNPDLLTRILDGLKASDIDLDKLRPEDLAPVDEFHIGGRKATAHAVTQMALNAGDHVLDMGCGIGGATRYIASSVGCHVTGIDLTSDYISIAKSLSQMTDLTDKTDFHVGSALDMPFESGNFDAAITFHVAMNIPDRAALYAEAARVMKPGATFCIYDVMKKNDEDLTFPVPWADTPETSHLVTPEDMYTLLDDVGFAVEMVVDRTEFALGFFRERLDVGPDGPPPLGVHLVIGPSARVKFENTLANTETGRVAPVLMIARRQA